MSMPAKSVGLFIVAFALSTGAWSPAGTPWGASRAKALDPLCTELGVPLVDHSCFHAFFGPFANVTAVAALNYAAATPNVNAVHTHYTVTLPGGSPGAHEGTIKYRPVRSGEWTIFTNPGVAMQVLDPSDVPRPVLLQHNVPSCPQLPLTRVYELTANVTYRLRFTGVPQSTVAVVIEKLSDFDTTYYEDSDDDAFGDPESPYTTPCVPPAGYVADDTDCDDTRAAVHPGATEICDTRDNDCDGQNNEGLMCAAPVPALGPGAGACAGLLLLGVGGLAVRSRRTRMSS